MGVSVLFACYIGGGVSCCKIYLLLQAVLLFFALFVGDISVFVGLFACVLYWL